MQPRHDFGSRQGHRWLPGSQPVHPSDCSAPADGSSREHSDEPPPEAISRPPEAEGHTPHASIPACDREVGRAHGFMQHCGAQAAASRRPRAPRRTIPTGRGEAGHCLAKPRSWLRSGRKPRIPAPRAHPGVGARRSRAVGGAAGGSILGPITTWQKRWLKPVQPKQTHPSLAEEAQGGEIQQEMLDLSGNNMPGPSAPPTPTQPWQPWDQADGVCGITQETIDQLLGRRPVEPLACDHTLGDPGGDSWAMPTSPERERELARNSALPQVPAHRRRSWPSPAGGSEPSVPVALALLGCGSRSHSSGRRPRQCDGHRIGAPDTHQPAPDLAVRRPGVEDAGVISTPCRSTTQCAAQRKRELACARNRHRPVRVVKKHSQDGLGLSVPIANRASHRATRWVVIDNMGLRIQASNKVLACRRRDALVVDLCDA